MYANVVVLTYQPPEIDFYTYEVPKELENIIKPGQLIFVPFGKRNPVGLILATRNQKPETSITIKPITSIIFQPSILLPYQIELLKWMAFYYHAPMVKCLEAMIPEIPTSFLNNMRVTRAEGVPLSAERPQASKEQNATDDSTNFVISYRLRTSSGTSSRQDPQSQTIVLVPTINRLPETLARFAARRAKYPQAKNYVIYHNELKTSEKFAIWLKILSGNADFIFGSRLAIFAPCPDLAKIIIYDEHDDAYKDERSPYYDTLTVAEKISSISGCKIQIFDSSPKITTYFNYKKQIALNGWQSWKGPDSAQSPYGPLAYHGKTLKTSTDGPPKASLAKSGKETTDRTRVAPKVKIVSMATEKAAGNKSSISDVLSTYLKLAHKKDKKILLFLNKKRGSGNIYCKNCKHNEFMAKQPETCPNCQSPNIWFNSLNVNSLTTLVQKILPDAHIRPITDNRQLATGNWQLATIDIATASVFYRLTPVKYDLVAHIATDSTLNIRDIKSSEKTYSQITDLKKLASGLLILQTYNPDHLAIKTAAAGQYLAFFKNQLTEREALSYPPFALILKLSIKGKKEEKIEEKAQNLFQDLNQQPILPKKPDEPATIIGPYKSFFEKNYTKYNIILKIPIEKYSLSYREKAIFSLSSFLDKIPRDWQITVEPASLN